MKTSEENILLQRAARGVARVLETVIVISLAIMALLVFGNVVLRYAFNSGIAISEELSRLLFVWLIFLGAILASAQHAHIGFDTLVKILPVAGRKILIVVTGGLMLAASVIFIIGGWQQTVINLDNAYPVLGISYAWLYAVAIVFGIGTLVTISYNIWMALSGKDGEQGLALTQDLSDRIEEKLSQVAIDDRREPPR